MADAPSPDPVVDDLPERAEVLVVGAGPAGVTAALALARAGIDPLVIDRRPGPGGQTRAVWIQPGSLEIWHHLGVADAIVAQAQEIRGIAVHGRRRDMAWLPLDEPDLSVHRPVLLDQPSTEAALLAGLDRAGIRVRWGWRFAELRRPLRAGAHAATVEAGPRRRVVRCREVVAADGSHSAVRAALGLRMTGHTYPRVLYVADLTADLAVERDRAHVLLAGDGAHALLPLPRDRWRLAGTAPACDEDDLRSQATTAVRRLGGDLRSLDAASTHQAHRRILDSFRHPGISLVGDAAHLHSPVGGQGMNLAVADGHAIGGAVADALRGTDRRAVEEAAARRRRAAVRALRTTDVMFRVQTAPGRAAALVRPLAFRGLSAVTARSRTARRVLFRSVSQVPRPGR
ncbi:FAD-dependent oxidoreductase [Euzebya sp.]|uniref:FAD-dependent oxidoreductase n=1 Tax=Euzebya sp. TaxID=1971409 RepID=UPI003513AA5E